MKFTKAELEELLEKAKKAPDSSWYGGPPVITLDRIEAKTLLSIIESIVGLSWTLNHIQSMAGNPDASEGCRKIIGQSKEALEKWGVGE